MRIKGVVFGTIIKKMYNDLILNISVLVDITLRRTKI